MKRPIIQISIVLSAMSLLTQCYYDQEDEIYPEARCDNSTTPTLSVDVMPLLDAKCNNCHAGTFASGNIRLDTYPEIMKSVENGSLMGSINFTGGFSPMPKNSSKMSNCEIQTIQNWIDAGANDN